MTRRLVAATGDGRQIGVEIRCPGLHFQGHKKMNHEELMSKLGQIEEQAKLTLSEFPKSLTQERQRMIIGLARYLRTELAHNPPWPPQAAKQAYDPEATRPLDSRLVYTQASTLDSPAGSVIVRKSES